MAGCGLALLVFSQMTTATLLALSTTFEFFSSIGWGALHLYTPEALPTTLRATGLGCCSALSRLAGTLSPSVGQTLLEGGGDPATPLIIYGLVYLVGAVVCVYCLQAETAGKTLSDGVGSSVVGVVVAGEDVEGLDFDDGDEKAGLIAPEWEGASADDSAE